MLWVKKKSHRLGLRWFMFLILSLIFTPVLHIQESRFYKVCHEKLLSQFLPHFASSSALQRWLLSLLDISFHITPVFLNEYLSNFYEFQFLKFFIGFHSRRGNTSNCCPHPFTFMHLPTPSYISGFWINSLIFTVFIVRTTEVLFLPEHLGVLCLPVLRCCTTYPLFATPVMLSSLLHLTLCPEPLTWYICTILFCSPMVTHGLLL